MTTAAEVRDLILGDIHRSNLTTQVETAMANTLTHLRQDRYYFNEGVTSFTATLATDYEIPTYLPDILEVDELRIWHAGAPYVVDRIDWGEMSTLDESSGTSAPPSFWSVHHQLLRIYPEPSATMTVEVTGLKELSIGAWCSYAPTLIRSYAQVELYSLVLHDDARAMTVAQYAQAERAKLARRLPTFDSGGTLRPYL
jgi:hypothetical protein